MSELKVHRFITTDELFPEANAGALYYDKSEADKVISELKQRLALVNLTLRLNKPEALYSDLETMGRLSHEIDVVARRERHQKYKRCSAMAKRCHWKKLYWRDSIPAYSNQFKWENRADKWEKRWLKLADKFKDDIK